MHVSIVVLRTLNLDTIFLSLLMVYMMCGHFGMQMLARQPTDWHVTHNKLLYCTWKNIKREKSKGIKKKFKKKEIKAKLYSKNK